MSFWKRFLRNFVAKDEIKPEECPNCDDVVMPQKKGNGICSRCRGKGSTMTTLSEMWSGNPSKCHECKGSGKCPTCKGIGYIKPSFRHHGTKDIPSLSDSAQDSEPLQAVASLIDNITSSRSHIGKVRKVENMLAANPSLVSTRYLGGATALHAAAACNCLYIVQLLISKGADVNAKNSDGCTPLHMAAMTGYSSAIIEMLLSSGADVNSKTNDGETPLGVMASWMRDGAVAKLLEDHVGKRKREETLNCAKQESKSEDPETTSEANPRTDISEQTSQGDKMPNKAEGVDDYLKASWADCDYALAAAMIARHFQNSVVKTELTSLIKSFTENPCFETAFELVECEPDLIVYIHQSKSGRNTSQR